MSEKTHNPSQDVNGEMNLGACPHHFEPGQRMGVSNYRGMCHYCRQPLEIADLHVAYLNDEIWGQHRMHHWVILNEVECPTCHHPLGGVYLYCDPNDDPALWKAALDASNKRNEETVKLLQGIAQDARKRSLDQQWAKIKKSEKKPRGKKGKK